MWKFKEKLPHKEKFYSLLTGKKLLTKNMIMFLMFGINLKWKQWTIIMTCALKCDVLLSADVLKVTRDAIYISNRYNKVNNKYLKSYDPKQESKHIYLTQIICMAMQLLNFFQQVDSKILMENG